MARFYRQVSGTILGLLQFLPPRRIGFVIGSGATLKIPIMEIARVIASNH
jgi:hypothetical protein